MGHSRKTHRGTQKKQGHHITLGIPSPVGTSACSHRLAKNIPLPPHSTYKQTKILYRNTRARTSSSTLNVVLGCYPVLYCHCDCCSAVHQARTKARSVGAGNTGFVTIIIIADSFGPLMARDTAKLMRRSSQHQPFRNALTPAGTATLVGL